MKVVIQVLHRKMTGNSKIISCSIYPGIGLAYKRVKHYVIYIELITRLPLYSLFPSYLTTSTLLDYVVMVSDLLFPCLLSDLSLI